MTMKAKRVQLKSRKLWRDPGYGPRKYPMAWHEAVKLKFFRLLPPPMGSILMVRQQRLPNYLGVLRSYRAIRRHFRWGVR